jgi:hypothetical protein
MSQVIDFSDMFRGKSPKGKSSNDTFSINKENICSNINLSAPQDSFKLINEVDFFH